VKIIHRISHTLAGIECRFCCQREGHDDINDIVMLSNVDDDPTDLIVAIAERISTVPPVKESPSILLSIEDDKERLKWEAVASIRNNPEMTPKEFLSSVPWKEAGIAQALIYSYAQMAMQKGMIPETPRTLEGCWSVLVGIVLSLNDDQLRDIL